MFYFIFIVLIFAFAVIFNFKSIFLKLILLIYWYPLVTMYLFCLNIPLGSSLDYIGRPHNEAYSDKALIFALLSYFAFTAVIWKIRHKRYVFKRVKISEESRLFIVFLLYIVSILAFPKAFGIGNERWNLIPGPWPVLFISFNAVLLLSFNSFKSYSSKLHLIILPICLIGGERVNSILVLVLLFLLDFSEDKLSIREKKINVKVLFYLLGLVFVSIGSQFWRVGESLSLEEFYINLMSVSTVSDVVHIYFSSFGYVLDKGVNLRPLLNELGSFLYLPEIGGTGRDNIYNFTEILRNYMINYGGGLFYTEGNVVFGNYGIILYGFLYGFFVRFIFLKKTLIYSTVMIVFLILQMRIQWYGLPYLYSPIWLTLGYISVLDAIRRHKLPKRNRFNAFR